MGAVDLVYWLSQILLAICGIEEGPIKVVARIGTLLDFACIIAGNVLVYRNWSTIDLEDENSENYCDKTAYLFSFVSLIVRWATFLFFVVYDFI